MRGLKGEDKREKKQEGGRKRKRNNEKKRESVVKQIGRFFFFLNSKSDGKNWCLNFWLTPQVGVRTLSGFGRNFIQGGQKSPAAIQDKIRFSHAPATAGPPKHPNEGVSNGFAVISELFQVEQRAVTRAHFVSAQSQLDVTAKYIKKINVFFPK